MRDDVLGKPCGTLHNNNINTCSGSGGNGKSENGINNNNIGSSNNGNGISKSDGWAPTIEKVATASLTINYILVILIIKVTIINIFAIIGHHHYHHWRRKH
jgi:hypothetical protein